MGKVIIDYSDIKSSSKKAKTVAGYYSDFANDLEKKVSYKLSGIPGSDSKGHVSHAQSVVSAKVRELRNKSSNYHTIAQSIEVLAAEIENHEKNVVSGVKSIATNALELKNQGFLETVGQWLYGTFCVDLVNWNPVTRAIGNTIKKGLDWVQEKGSKIVDWFKHGDGKYFLGIALDVLGVVVSIAATVGAIALTVATGGLAAPLLVAAIASTIGTVMTMVDSGFSIYNKVKALKISSNSDDPGRARYYGEIGGVNDTIKKTDMGGKGSNTIWGITGTGYDIIHVAAEITAFVSGTIGSAGLKGEVVTNAKGHVELKTTYDKSVIKSNLKSSFLEKIGFRSTGGKWTFSIKNLFSTKSPTGTIPKLDVLKKDIIGDLIGDKTYKTINTIKKVAEYPGKIYKTFTNFEKIITPDTSGWDKIKSVLNLGGETKFKISSPIKDFNKTVVKLIDTFVSLGKA